MKYILLVAVCLLTALGLIGLGKTSSTEASLTLDPTPTPTPVQRLYGSANTMPEELKYWVLFKQIETVKARDVENQASGEPSFFKKSFYEDRLKLTSSQFASMDSIAADCLTELQPVEQRARLVINQYRAPYPNGELKKAAPTPPQDPLNQDRFASLTEPLPPVPAELTQLQNQKNQIVLNARERLRQAFGTSGFAAFETAVNENATKVLSPINLGTKKLPHIIPTPTPGS